MTHRAFASAVVAVLAVATPNATAQTSPPATDIYLAPIRLLESAPTMGPARVASENPKGYDNQPFFGPDGRAMLFTSNREIGRASCRERV